MVSILGISGSPRKSATYHSLQLALEAAAKENCEVEIVSLHGEKMTPCIHCDRCKREQKLCHFEDYMQELYPKLMQTDAIIAASPVYAMNITPQLSAFFSRWRPLHHVRKGVMCNKLFAGIAVGGTRNGGQEITLCALTHAAMARGLIVVGNEPGFYSGGMVWSKDLGRLGVEADEIGKESLIKLGQRVAKIAKIFKAGNEKTTNQEMDG